VSRPIERCHFTPVSHKLDIESAEHGLIDVSAVETVRVFLNDVAYGFVGACRLPATEGAPFPPFRRMRAAIGRLSKFYRLLFGLLRQGLPIEDRLLRQVLPLEVVRALVSTGLIVPCPPNHWQTPGLALVCVEGLVLAVSLPPEYPTARSTARPIYIGADSLRLIRACPPNLAGQRVLDVCAGSGVLGLVCLARGASRVVAVEKNPVAVRAARFNAHLNDLADRMDVRESDLFDAVDVREPFDFIVCNPPFLPVSDDWGFPMCGAGGLDGTQVLREILNRIPAQLSSTGQALVLCTALGRRDSPGANVIEDALATMTRLWPVEGRAWIYTRRPIEQYMRAVRRFLSRTHPQQSDDDCRRLVSAWRESLQRVNIPAECLYGELIRVRRSSTPGVMVMTAPS